MRSAVRWSPTVVLGLGALMTVGIDTQRDMPLRAPLAASVPETIAGMTGRDITLSDAEIRVAGVDAYLMRAYAPADSVPDAAASLYIGYYERQTQGRTIHSPKNCLPGAGWEALASQSVTIRTPGGPVDVNRYLLKRGTQTALVLYWYQGRGRVEANEYLVKRDLLRDAALRQRSEEALVRIVVPVQQDEASAFQTAERVAAAVVPALARALPE